MIRTVLGNLDSADGQILRDALANQDAWSNRELARALTDRGLPLGEHIIRQRRMNPCDDCVCRVN
jgi:hypothetical protein